jgi:hypothetical protein
MTRPGALHSPTRQRVSSAAWKDHERRVAHALGGKRRGLGGGSDVVGVPWAVECKRSSRGAILTSWLEQARKQGKREGCPWLLVVSQHNDPAPTVTLPFSDFLTVLHEAGRLGSPCLSAIEWARRTGYLIAPEDRLDALRERDELSEHERALVLHACEQAAAEHFRGVAAA